MEWFTSKLTSYIRFLYKRRKEELLIYGREIDYFSNNINTVTNTTSYLTSPEIITATLEEPNNTVANLNTNVISKIPQPTQTVRKIGQTETINIENLLISCFSMRWFIFFKLYCNLYC